jgi:DNA/RNA endonuclease G (NUC1)
MNKVTQSALIVFALLVSGQALGKTRNCTKAEKAEANRYLLQIESNAALKGAYISEHLPYGLPENVIANNNEVLVNGGYVMDYDPDLRTSTWAGYHLTKTDRINTSGKDRVNCFREDPRIEVGGPDLNDYKEPVFDQGHLTNDADLKDELIEQLNTYVMTNMSPQYCRFNRGIWLSAENLIREWAYSYGDIYVLTGTIFDADHDGQRDSDDDSIKMHSSNGEAFVSVPSAQYKIAYRQAGGQLLAIGMLLENTNDKHGVSWKQIGPKLKASITPIEEIEQVAGVQFFPKLSGDLIERESDWSFSQGKNNMEFSCK